MNDGRTLRGRVAGADESTATIVDEFGQVIALELTAVLTLRQVEGPLAPPLPATVASQDTAGVADATKPHAWNVISIHDPFRYGLTSYVPRFGGGIRYGRRIRGPHWVYISIGSFLDYGDWRKFHLDDCGLGNGTASCGKGVVAGIDVRIAWAYEHIPRHHPKLSVTGRLGVGAGWWKLPEISGTRLQSRESSRILSVIPGMGFRYAPAKVFALGFDAGIMVGLSRSSERPLAQLAETVTEFLLALELDPLVLEFRF